MAKRSWQEASASLHSLQDMAPPSPIESRRGLGYDLPPPGPGGASRLVLDDAPRRPNASAPYPSTHSHQRRGKEQQQEQQQEQNLGSVEISRKVKACAACRKQKIRCHMDDGKPPCTRCKQRNLSCVLNKSLQMLVDERSQWHKDIVSDLERLRGGLQEVREQAGLPPLPLLRSSSINRPGSRPLQTEENECGGTSCEGFENSPAVAAVVEGGTSEAPTSILSAVPWVQLDDTHHPPPSGVPGGRDFIAANQISLADAQRLFDLYMGRLDYFIYNIGGHYRTIEALRSHSAILTASILTVAAVHDPHSADLYPVCSRELRRLVAASVFDRCVGLDHLRALCVTAHWLSDVGWALLGLGLRRAAEADPAVSHRRVLAGAEAGGVDDDDADRVRVWYHLYACDRHLSILRGRPSLAREDACVLGWEGFLGSPASTHQDKVLAMQLALQLILARVGELFGPNDGAPVPAAYSTQIAYYGHQLDNWLGVWSTALREASSTLGEFPIKAALVYHHFAKLYLFSHVFRGLPDAESVPPALRDAAAGAAAAATDTVGLFVAGLDASDGLLGVPACLYAMAGHACVLLLRMGSRRPGDGLVGLGFALDLTTRLVRVLRGVRVTRWHLARAVADGLERSAALAVQGLRAAGGSACSFGGGDDNLARVAVMETSMEDASGMPFGLCPPTSHALGSVGGGVVLPPDPLQGAYLNFGGQAELFEFDAAGQRALGNDDRIDFCEAMAGNAGGL